jgi:hypothetical protein
MNKNYWEFGGTLLRHSHAKIRRPIILKSKMLIVLSTQQARGPYSFHRFRRQIEKIARQTGQAHNIRLFDLHNGGHHLQIIIKASSKNEFKNFLRALTGKLARLILKAEKAKPGRISLWTHRPYSREVQSIKFPNVALDWIIQDRLHELGLAEFFSSS